MSRDFRYLKGLTLNQLLREYEDADTLDDMPLLIHIVMEAEGRFLDVDEMAY